jgi:molybdate transport system substrate-binding protein
MAATLHLLCAGAAQGLVQALSADFQAATGAAVQARFGAVGAMKEALLAGAPCDVMVVTQAMVDALAEEGRLLGSSRAALGRVRTGLAVRAGAPRPDVDTPEALRTALRAADAIYFPDPVRATAGIHFARVMRELGVHDELEPRFRTFPNGATAMREMAASTAASPVGCTQVSEILISPGVALVAALPARFELATVYAAAVAAGAADVALAARFIERLSGPASQALRTAGGIEP